MKRTLQIMVTAIFAIAFSIASIHDLISRNNKLELQSVQLLTTHGEINQLELEQKALNEQIEDEVNKKEIDEKKARELEEKSLEQQKKQEALKSQVKSSSGKVYASTKISGNKEKWLEASGIPEKDWWAVDYIVSRESNWDPCAYYPGQSNCNGAYIYGQWRRPVTACGLVQQNPCGKILGHWTDPVAALKWQYNYVKERYGGYPQAVEFWKINQHY